MIYVGVHAAKNGVSQTCNSKEVRKKPCTWRTSQGIDVFFVSLKANVVG